VNTNNLGRIIKERRKAKNLTLKRLADMSGVHLAHLGRIERGERFPSAHVLRVLAEPLGFAEIDLFKLAGFLSRDESVDRLDKLKKEIKRELDDTLGNLHKKIDSL